MRMGDVSITVLAGNPRLTQLGVLKKLLEELFIDVF